MIGREANWSATASVIVLDEPPPGLDPERSRPVADRIEQTRGDGVGVVPSTRDLECAAEVADRIRVMADGNLVERGTPRRSPATELVSVSREGLRSTRRRPSRAGYTSAGRAHGGDSCAGFRPVIAVRSRLTPR